MTKYEGTAVCGDFLSWYSCTNVLGSSYSLRQRCALSQLLLQLQLQLLHARETKKKGQKKRADVRVHGCVAGRVSF